MIGGEIDCGLTTQSTADERRERNAVPRMSRADAMRAAVTAQKKSHLCHGLTLTEPMIGSNCSLSSRSA
jgi:hypothetical protein